MTKFFWTAAVVALAGAGCAGPTNVERRAAYHEQQATAFAIAGDAPSATREQLKADRLRRGSFRAFGYGRDNTQYPPGDTPPVLRSPEDIAKGVE